MPNPHFRETVEQMIQEQGSTAWTHENSTFRTYPENAVVITDNPTRCFRLTLPKPDGEWVIEESVLTTEELAGFFAAFGSHWRMLLSSKLTFGDDSEGKVRAFIKNGRKPGKDWSISLDMLPVATKAQAA